MFSISGVMILVVPAAHVELRSFLTALIFFLSFPVPLLRTSRREDSFPSLLPLDPFLLFFSFPSVLSLIMLSCDPDLYI